MNSNPFTAYIQTDLTAELISGKTGDETGVSVEESTENGVGVTLVRVLNEAGEKVIGKPAGTYLTLDVGKVWLLEDKAFDAAASVLSGKIRSLIREQSANSSDGAILIAGLGNADITSDSLGPAVLKRIQVTRHIRIFEPNLFAKLRSCEVAAVAPGVVGQTGIETADLISGAVKAVSPAVLIVIDALAARSPDRLGTTVQLSDSGLAPGSGIGNKRKQLDRRTLGVPVLAIGVPTVVNSSTLVYDALDKAGITDISPALTEILENGKSFFVSLKESDTMVLELARLIGKALDGAFRTDTDSGISAPKRS